MSNSVLASCEIYDCCIFDGSVRVVTVIVETIAPWSYFTKITSFPWGLYSAGCTRAYISWK